MRTHKRARTLLLVAVGGLLPLILIGVRRPERTNAQTQCPSIEQLGRSKAWSQNSDITIDLDPNFTNAQRECIKAGIRSWEGSNGASGSASGVRVTNFTVGQSTTGANTLVIQRSQGTFQSLGETVHLGTNAQGGLNTALTTLNAGITSCDALKEVAAHEFGHTLGLNHCTSCGSQTDSIMTTAPAGAYDSQNRLVNPNATKGPAGRPAFAAQAV